ncbi:MAG: TolC family protein, partial [Deltaproteobacteria bacterium]
SQTIPLAGKRGARTDAARAEAAFAESDLAVKQRDIETALASAYFELFLADRTQEVDDELETILKVLLLSSESRVSSGKGEQSELLRAQASLVQLRSNRESALDHKRSSWARLASLLDRNPAGPAGPTMPPNVLGNLPDVATLQKHALQARPELAGARARIAGADAEARLAKASSVPDLGVFVAEMHTFRNPAGPSDFLFAGVQINLPIFGRASLPPWRRSGRCATGSWPRSPRRTRTSSPKGTRSICTISSSPWRGRRWRARSRATRPDAGISRWRWKARASSACTSWSWRCTSPPTSSAWPSCNARWEPSWG